MSAEADRLLSQAEMDKTLKGISIPPRPQLLVRLDQEMHKNEPDPQVVAQLISADVGLSAAVLKAVNSPFFGLSRKISAVGNAVSMLGLNASRQIVTGLMLRNSVAGAGRSLERFWDSAEKVAGIAAYVASILPRGPRDDAYTFGLFRDIGIPILMEKFPDYRETLAKADSATERSLTEVEDEAHATNHATLGYLIAKGWFLPSTICEAILYHHDRSVFDDKESISPPALTLVAISHLAEHFNDEYVRMRSNPDWARMRDRVLAHLGLQETEYLDLRDELAMMIR